MSIFKACDVRGVYPDELDEEMARRIGRAVATTLGPRTVVVGGDVRLSTPALKGAIIDGLAASGCEAVDIGIVPTPALHFARTKLHATGGVMVTASHNPPQYNGLKIVLGDVPIAEEELAGIASVVERNEFASRKGSSRELDVTAEYEEFVVSEGRAILNCVERAPRVLERIGVPYAPLFCEIDGSFPNRSPNSAIAENLGALRERVVAEKADLGVAFDGDGDRVSFVDENGSVLTADQAISIVAKLGGFVASGDKVVLDIKCSSAAGDVVASLGASALMERSGHTFIRARMLRENAAFGGEISGHLFYRQLGGGDDGFFSTLVMAGIVGERGPLSKLAAGVPEYAITPDLRISMKPDRAVLDAIAEAFPEDRVSRLDGVRVEFDEGWGLARLSVTEPVITLRFEAKDKAALRRVMNEFLSAVPELKEAVLGEYEF